MDDSKELIDPKKKITLALSLLAYEESRKNIEQHLAWLEPLIGKYKIVWGPAFHYNLLHKTDSMTYIVNDLNNPTEFYVVSRGTTPLTLSDWIFHDLLVGAMVKWDMVPFEGILPPTPPHIGTPAISFATNNALAILINVLKDNSININTFLQNQARQSKQTITIHLTGHSLGGVLASTFALYLHDHWPKELPQPIIIIYSYAAPTAGNQQFAVLSNQTLGAGCKIYQNPLDIATHVWDIQSMKELPSLYSPLIMPSTLLKILNKIAIPAVKNNNYTQIEVKQPYIPSKVVEFWFLNEYVVQMIYQHLLPYLADFINLCPESSRGKLIDSTDSWEIVKTYKELKPLSNTEGKDLRYYLDLLG